MIKELIAVNSFSKPLSFGHGFWKFIPQFIRMAIPLKNVPTSNTKIILYYQSILHLYLLAKVLQNLQS